MKIPYFPLLLWLAVMVPTAFHEKGMLSLGNYHFKIAYVGFLATLSYALFTNWRAIFVSIRQFWFLAFLGMAVSGFISAFCFSIYPERSLVMTAWTVATVLTVPFIVPLLIGKRIAVFSRSVSIFVLCQALVIGYDFSVALLGHASWSLGHVGEIQNSWLGITARPSAFRGEPGYYAASVLLWCLVVRVSLPREPSAFWRRFGRAAWILGLVSVVLCGSRMGFVGVVATLGLEIAFFIFNLPTFRFIRSAFAKPNGRRLMAISVLLLALSGALFLVFKGQEGYLRFQQKIQRTGTDPTVAIRGYRLVAAMELFRAHLWLGVGAGTAGAAFAASEAEIPRSLMGRFLIDMGDDPASLSRNPLSHNLFTELLSEWGLIGTLFFFAGLFFLLRQLPISFFLTALAILGVIYLSSETIARFDLWLALAALVSFGVEPT